MSCNLKEIFTLCTCLACRKVSLLYTRMYVFYEEGVLSSSIDKEI